MRQDFNQLERDVLRWIKDHDPVSGLAAQIDNAAFRSREYTVVGFFVSFDVPDDTPRIESSERDHDGPYIESPHLEWGAGTILWVEDGVASCLEMFAYGDLFPEELTEYRLELARITRA